MAERAYGVVEPQSWVHCKNGHRICFCEQGLGLGEAPNTWGTRFSKWQQRERKVGEPMISAVTCDECGALWDWIDPKLFTAARVA